MARSYFYSYIAYRTGTTEVLATSSNLIEYDGDYEELYIGIIDYAKEAVSSDTPTLKKEDINIHMVAFNRVD